MARKTGSKKPNPVAAFFGFTHHKTTSVPAAARARKPRSGKTADATGPRPVAAHMFSGRFVLGLAILVFIAFAAYAPLSTFLTQQAEINQVEENIARLESENQQLQTQLSWWQDDNYVRQQARSRLFYVTDGETPYLVTGADDSTSLADDTSAAAQTAPEQSWTNSLWTSFQESALQDQEPRTSQSSTAQPTASEGSVTPGSTGSSESPGPENTPSPGPTTEGG